MDFLTYENKLLLPDFFCNEINKIINETKMYISENYIEKKFIENNNIENYLFKIINENLIEYFKKLHIDDNNLFSTFIINKKISLINYRIYNIYKNCSLDKNNLNNIIFLKNNKKKILNCLLYLNDIEENNCETEINNYKIKCEKGKIVLYPSEWFISHNENNFSSNNKYIILIPIFIDIK